MLLLCAATSLKLPASSGERWAGPYRPTPLADCKQDVLQAYAQLAAEAAAQASQAGPAVYRVRSTTQTQLPGQRQPVSRTHTITVAAQRGNTYYSDGSTEVYSSAKERVVVDRQHRTLLLLDNVGTTPTGASYGETIALIRSRLLDAAQVSSCSQQTINGQTCQRVCLTLPAALQRQLRIVSLTSLLTGQHHIQQTSLTFTASEPVRQVSFSVLPLDKAAAAIQAVRPPLEYVYRPDHSRQPEFAHYQLLDQRQSAH